MAISNCVLSIVELESKQLIFSIPCQAVLGWGSPAAADQLDSNIRELHIYYGKGERLSLEVEGAETRDEIVSRLVDGHLRNVSLSGSSNGIPVG